MSTTECSSQSATVRHDGAEVIGLGGGTLGGVSGDDTPARGPGDVIVLADVIGTVVFVATAVFAAVVFSTTAQWVGAITAFGLFAIGVFAFLWSFYNAVQRSRDEQISVMQVYLLLGPPTPSRVRRIMSAMLAVQCITALVTALARTEGPDGSPGTSLAVGILVPMFGIGLNGLWCAFHGVFPPRDEHEPSFDDDEEPPAGDATAISGADGSTSLPAIGKNGDHG